MTYFTNENHLQQEGENMNDYSKIFTDFLLRKEMKFTNSRKIILDTVFSLHDHFDIETLYETIKTKHNNVSRATIYRAIPLLIEAGLLKKSLRSLSKDKYEHIFGHPSHLHLICDKCGKIIEEVDKDVENLLNKIAIKYDFKIKEVNVSLRGFCSDCVKVGSSNV